MLIATVPKLPELIDNPPSSCTVAVSILILYFHVKPLSNSPDAPRLHSFVTPRPGVVLTTPVDESDESIL